MVVATFRTAFPATALWQGGGLADYFVIGQAAPRPVDLGRFDRIFTTSPRLREDLDRLGHDSWAAVLADFRLGADDTARYAAGARINTDDTLPLEFSAPLSLYVETTHENFERVEAFKTAALPALAPAGAARLETAAARASLGHALARKGLDAAAERELEAARALDPRHLPGRLELGRLHRRQNRVLPALAAFEAALALDPRHVATHLEIAKLCEDENLPERAVDFAARAARLDPLDPSARVVLASAEAARAQHRETAEHYLRAWRPAPADASARGRDGAAGAAVVSRWEPLLAHVYADLAAARLAAGETLEAIDALERAVRLDPRQPGLARQLAELRGR
jgi:tetratricopeptide (TPR) repeat protein